MRYLALLGGTESAAPWDRGVAAHQWFTDAAGDAVRAGGALHPIAMTTTVQVRDGEVMVTDGPFAESAEVVGGFYLLRAADRDEAVAVAKGIPADAVELRPIGEVGG